jgi:hypothetical protein
MDYNSPEPVPPSVKVAPALWGAVFSLALFPAVLSGQGAARDALASFPADTQQLAYVNLAQLRSMPEYPQIRRRLLDRQLRDFQEFLRSMGTDPDKDVDEVVLGWRGEASGGAGLFGRAEGRFDPERVRRFFVQQQLPLRQHAGLELYAYGAGEDPSDIFFAFFNSSSAAFGRLRDLEEILDVRAGGQPALDSNAEFVDWEAELEGSSPQWGIATGKAAASQAAPWLAAGGKLAVDPGVMFNPVRAVLYRVDWGSTVNAHIVILCQDSDTAGSLSALLNVWRDSRQRGGTDATPGVNALLQGLAIQASGSRVELTASGPMEAIDQILHGPMGGGAP